MTQIIKDQPYIAQSEFSGGWFLVQTWRPSEGGGKEPVSKIDITALVPDFKKEVLRSDDHIVKLTEMLVKAYYEGVKRWEQILGEAMAAAIASEPDDKDFVDMRDALTALIEQVGPLIDSMRPMVVATTEKQLRDDIRATREKEANG